MSEHMDRHTGGSINLMCFVISLCNPGPITNYKLCKGAETEIQTIIAKRSEASINQKAFLKACMARICGYEMYTRSRRAGFRYLRFFALPH